VPINLKDGLFANSLVNASFTEMASVTKKFFRHDIFS